MSPKLKVLIVEDDFMIADMAEEILVEVLQCIGHGQGCKAVTQE